jgi:hypothetical protein
MIAVKTKIFRIISTFKHQNYNKNPTHPLTRSPLRSSARPPVRSSARPPVRPSAQKVINTPTTFPPSTRLSRKNTMKKQLTFIFLALLTGISCRSQIAAWDFYGQSFPATCAATTFNPNLVSVNGASNITRGAGAPASGGVNSFRTTGFQNNGISTAATDYFQITLQAMPGYKISLTTLDAKFNGTASFFASPGVTSQFAYSLDGTAFTLIGSPVQSSSLTMAQVDLSSVPDLQNVYEQTTVTIRYYASGQTSTGGWGFYSGTPGTNGLTVGGTVSEAMVAVPAIQSSGLLFSNIQQTQMSVSWTPGSGERRIVKINTVNNFTDPVNGTDPPANPVYPGTGEQVIYNNSGSSVPAVTGLATGVTYWFRIYEYNGSGALTVFNTTSAVNNPCSQAASGVLLSPAIISPAVSQVTSVSAILGGHVMSDGGSAVTERGTVWKTTSPVTISDNKLPEGIADTGVFSHPRNSLPPVTLIHYAAYATNAVGTSMTPEAAFFTLANEPPSHVSGFTASPAGTTAITLSWNALTSGAGGYLVLQRQGTTPPAGLPQDATQYTPGMPAGDGIIAANITPGNTSAQIIGGLSPGTGYSFTIFPYAWDGSNEQTTNYYTQAPVPSSYASTAIPAVATYHWTGASGTDWTFAGNWVPARTVPALNDRLIFDIGGSWTITNVPAQTIGQLTVMSATSVTLQGSGILGIAGDTGDDLIVAAGCQLNISGTSPVSVSLAAGATGVVNGSTALSGGGHRLLAASANGLTFTSGSQFKAGTGLTGNPFGTANLNSVIFTSGSTYVCQAGGNPFGVAAPSSVVVFQPGSLFRIDAYVVPSLGGRTYGNFEMNYPGLITATGSSAVSIDNFTASQGYFYLNVTGAPGHAIRGNIFVSAVATLIFSPSSAGTIILGGTGPQSISGTGTLIAGSNSTFIVTNLAGVTINMDATLNNVTIANGARLTIAPNGKLTVSGNLVNSGPASGLVVEPDGSMIHATAGVPGMVKRFFAAATWSDWQDGWHFLSSPVAGQPFNEEGGFITGGEGNEFDLYAWSEPNDQWVNIKNTTVPPLFSTVNPGNEFVAGKGYLAAYQQQGDKTFTGVLNVSDVPVDNLTVTGTGNHGWHLLGNPFASGLVWYSDWVTSNIGGVAYTWNEAGMSYTPRNPGDIIPACNGFMVRVIENPDNTGSLIIPAAKRVHGSQAWFKESEYPVITLFARNLDNRSFQECQVRFNPASTMNVDPVFDGVFLPGYAPYLYSVCGNEKLAVHALPGPDEGLVIPLGFEKNNGDHYRIEAQIPGGVAASIVLTDKIAGRQHNLLTDAAYEFTASDKDAPGRFELRFSHVGVGEPPGQSKNIYSSGKNIFLHHCGESQVEVYSILGKLMVSRTLAGSGTDKIEVAALPGWYLVRLTKGKDIEVTRVFINSSYQ